MSAAYVLTVVVGSAILGAGLRKIVGTPKTVLPLLLYLSFLVIVGLVMALENNY